MVSDVIGCCEAWYLSENRARKRWARGADSEVRTLRRCGIAVSSEVVGVVGSDVAEGAMMSNLQGKSSGRTGKSQIVTGIGLTSTHIFQVNFQNAVSQMKRDAIACSSYR